VVGKEDEKMKKERREFDAYETPINSIVSLLSRYPLGNGTILEPSAGSGNFVRTLRKLGYTNHITGVEVRGNEVSELEKYCDEVICGDFLTYNFTQTYDIIFGNPPYNQAMDFVTKSLGLLDRHGALILLLRTAFLESKKRHEFWQANPVTRLWVLSERPSFTGDGNTDNSSYSWFIWEKGFAKNQEIKVI
jgi:hypothetical protein